MISKALVKLIRSLDSKKGRQRENLFVAEGPKVVGDLMQKHRPQRLVATAEWYEAQRLSPRQEDAVVTEEELRRVSFLQHPQQVIGLFCITDFQTDAGNGVGENLFLEHSGAEASRDLCLALDGVQDPGNLGTIIRIADWFGISTIFCSPDTADAYNPKVVQATMGSLARVNIVYTSLPELFGRMPGGVPIFGTFLDGESLYSQSLPTHGIIVMGNEGNGISPDVARCVSHRLLIPPFPEGRATADSLNVAIATAITCAEFRRRMF